MTSRPTWLSALLAGLVFLSVSAGETARAARGDLVSAVLVTNMTADALHAQVDAALAASEYNGILDDLWAWIQRAFRRYRRFDLDLVVLEYRTERADGAEITVTGLLAVPVTAGGTVNTSAVPVLSLQHPTQVERKYSPSLCGLLDPELTVPIGALIAGSGYLVTMADYPGLGTNTDIHPYCQNSLANSVIDMIRASLAYVAGNTNPAYPAWDRRLYLTGYSEGGYATLSTAKYLQRDHADEFAVSAVAPLDGPHSLSDTMRTVMLTAGTNYNSPYFLPYVINAYDDVYGGIHPVFRFTNAVKNTVPGDPLFSSTLRRMVTDGTNSGAEINAQMFKAVPYIGPRSILTNTYLESLADPDSLLCRTLGSNDSYASWTPAMPIRLMHNADDDLVPFGNSTNALCAFTRAGATNTVLDAFHSYDYPLIYLMTMAMGSVHAATCPFAYYRAFQWLDSLAYPNRATLLHPFFDTDGDMVADLTVYHPADGHWYTLETVLDRMVATAWGWADTVPVPADYDGDAKTDLAVYWPLAGMWYFLPSRTGAPRDLLWGWADTLPVPADYDGDRIADPAVYWPLAGMWYALLSADQTVLAMPWGWAGALPVPGDYNSDTLSDLAVYNPLDGTWYILSGAVMQVRVEPWGFAGAAPVPADYDQDGILDLAVYDAASGMWYIKESRSGAMRAEAWGFAGATPMPADYDGDSRIDLAVYWPAGCTWFILESRTGAMRQVGWGLPGAVPADNQNRLNRTFGLVP
jgi:hypothetical protein